MCPKDTEVRKARDYLLSCLVLRKRGILTNFGVVGIRRRGGWDGALVGGLQGMLARTGLAGRAYFLAGA